MAAPGSGLELGSAPRHVGTAQPPGTGWERLRELWHRDELQHYPEETLNIIKATFSAAVIGWMYGGLPAFHHAKTQYIERSQAEIFQNRLDAVQSAHRAAIRGFIRYGWRWSWRIATFVAIFKAVLSSVLFVQVCLLTLSVPHTCSTVSTGLSVYRNKTTFSHFAAAGAFTGGLFRMHLGLSRMAAGSVFGAAFGIPAGGLLMAVQKLSGESIQEKRLRERRLLHEQKLAEWKARLNFTEADLEEIVSNTQEGTMERDIEKIQELLNLPKNPLPSKDGN
ncbi:complex I assembly factor TIMMDC1, mitochondrial isoform X1 [Gopherus flavomarginatus]|uniref:complex I assembly factor TIMMDC1, mitochondrial isoform X1 n=1 Tax=Gopherus flavomarginatus TaxID=286002 RepID=UPI0021CBF3DF|nr:complex I assembly factor TIMMDC1, mitochondrial isoform X1 [Gopherus flavomarginatus]